MGRKLKLRYDYRRSATWAFKCPRVPVKALFENLEDRVCVDDFLEWFPGAIREQIGTVGKHKLIAFRPPALQQCCQGNGHCGSVAS